MAHLFDPFFVADLLLRIGRAGLHVVLEAERMADLVSNDVFDKLSHQVVRHREFLCTRIKCPDLREVPRTLKIHDVVIHLNVRLEDLACSRIVDVRARGVLDGRGQPADDRVACVFRIEVWIFGFGRLAFCNDRILKACGLKCFLPFFDTSNGERNEPSRCCTIDVVNDRLDRL